MRVKLARRMLVIILLASGCADIPELGTDPPATISESEAVETSDEEAVAAAESALQESQSRRKVCGGPRNLRCGSDEVCSISSSNGCPSPGAFGTCQPRRLCPQNFDPVCGCDGKTYSNACTANAAGVSVRARGACAPSGPACGGFLGLACPGSGTCVDDPSDDCDPNAGGADCGGICMCRQQTACPVGTRFDARPNVCGCVPASILCPNAPCTVTTCSTGTRCVERDCKAVCEPIFGCGPCPPGQLCTDVCFPGPVATE